MRVHMEEGGWLLPLSRVALIKALQAMLEGIGEGTRCLDLHIVRDGRMAEENFQHMGCVGPTNVLSFPAEDTAESCGSGGSALASPLVLVDVVPGTLLLSVDTLHRECLLYGQDAAPHVLRLLAHGLGHVLGHDHGPEMDDVCRCLWVAGGAACGLAWAAADY